MADDKSPRNQAAEPRKPSVDVQSLLQGQQEVALLHRGEAYRLRITKQGKLILTK